MLLISTWSRLIQLNIKHRLPWHWLLHVWCGVVWCGTDLFLSASQSSVRWKVLLLNSNSNCNRFDNQINLTWRNYFEDIKSIVKICIFHLFWCSTHTFEITFTDYVMKNWFNRPLFTSYVSRLRSSFNAFQLKLELQNRIIQYQPDGKMQIWIWIELNRIQLTEFAFFFIIFLFRPKIIEEIGKQINKIELSLSLLLKKRRKKIWIANPNSMRSKNMRSHLEMRGWIRILLLIFGKRIKVTHWIG